MLKARKGNEIDQADCVIRMNNAPTVNYESDVGSKTTVRMVSHTSVPLLIKNDTYFFRQSADTVYIIWGPERNMRQDGKGRIFNALWKIARKYPRAKLYTMTRERILYCDNIFQNETGRNRMKSGAYLSTGFFTMVLAMDICDNILVYGMIDDSYCSQANYSTVPYHYYEKGRMDECRMYRAHERAPRGGHRFITEKAIFARWAARKHMTFSHPSWTDKKSVS
ncbi:SIA7D sialyltransferase, partial [Amia calva]|nr:SIA7D sialyltransferase [Amia calva]